LRQQNPWRELGQVPEELARPIRRPLADVLDQAVLASDPMRYQVVLGHRRVGKTTAMYQTVQRLLGQGTPPNRLFWIRLDHPLLLEQGLGFFLRDLMSPATAAAPMIFFLDELTYARDWDLWLKTAYDERWPVRIVATSSSSAALREGRAESGIGRWEEQYLPPWLFDEYLRLRGRGVGFPIEATLADSIEAAVAAPGAFAGLEDDRRRYLLVGGFPELLTAGAIDESSEILRSQQVLRADAVHTALYKDLRQAYGIADPVKLERLLYVLAGQAGGILSPSSLATDLELSQPTIDRYIALLERSYLIFVLPNYSAKEETVQRRRRKVYFVDGAVRNAALLRGLAPLRDPIEMGLLFENAVAAHLHALAQQGRGRLYHWRDGSHEVDLVFSDIERPIAIEVGSSPRHDVRGLQRFLQRYPSFQGRCYLVAPGDEPRSARATGVGRIPIDMMLVLTSLHVEAALRARTRALTPSAPGTSPPPSPAG
jgi:predicted AAA+ superfamily ATPase